MSGRRGGRGHEFGDDRTGHARGRGRGGGYERGRGNEGRGRGGRGYDRSGSGEDVGGYGGRGRGRGYEGGGRSGGERGYGTAGRGRFGRGETSGYEGRSMPQLPPPDMIASASILPRDEVEKLRNELQSKVKLGPTQSEPSSSSAEEAPPVSSAVVKFVPRPGFGSEGKPCVVRSNHFMVEVNDFVVHHYDVTISPEVPSQKVCRGIIKQLVDSYQTTHLGGRTPVYDGRKNMYTVESLPFEMKEFIVKYSRGGSSSSSTNAKHREFTVSIKHVSTLDSYRLKQFLSGKLREFPQDVVQVLDIVLRHTPCNTHTVVGRSLFGKTLGDVGDLGNGVEYWMGYYQSLRPTQIGLSLNVDISARAFYEPIPVSQFVVKYFNLRDSSRPLSDRDRINVKKALKGVQVKTSYRGFEKSFKIASLSNQPLNQITFDLDQKGKSTIIQYFKQKYNITLKVTSLPAIQVGPDSKPTYLPMELCTIVEGQRYTKKLSPKQVSSLLRATCRRPEARERSISDIVSDRDFENDKAVQEFGIEVRPDLTVVNARVLPPPSLKYHSSGRESDVRPHNGAWNMIDKKMVNGGTVEAWACVSFSSKLPSHICNQFCKQLVDMCIAKGMNFNIEPVIPMSFLNPNNIEASLKTLHTRTSKHLQLLIIILPDVKGSYGKIKRVLETELGIVSQCCLPEQAARLNKQYLENVSLKINAKAGGRNSVLRDAVQRNIPKVTDRPTIIFGADVTHPAPGDDSSPSIASVVASMDWPEITKYRGQLSAQKHRDEIIHDLYSSSKEGNVVTHSGMIRESLKAFRMSTNAKPARIIFYRDGVSEGQFGQVLLYEMDAIRKACLSLEEGYLPPVTFIVVQKRHHTRLFPCDRNLTDKSGNILPGTVVDKQICHPTEFDFYLNSHAGIQGTSRPTHYHVLYDENKFTADELQTFTNNLCYTYARCTRSVSIVPAVYYAHHLAFRGRYYTEDEGSDESSAGGVSRGGTEVVRLPTINPNVLGVMFYL